MDAIIRQLNHVLDFMLENIDDLPTVTTQHVAESFFSQGEDLSLVHVRSLLDTLETHAELIQLKTDVWQLTLSGKLVAQLGGYVDELSDEEE